ncbi:sialoadhesin-like [Betta splendens]|uniref:Sialoadhesin-like n=1 Tax=Betta splendens TaxID=158456 RepID=A0A9W2XQ17_BETSP|nr:sialoadhesin-like [Betta splendens]
MSQRWYFAYKTTSGCNLTEVNVEGNDKYNTANFTLKITNLTESDAKIYCYGDKTNPQSCWENAVNLQVTDVQVKVLPSTQGEAVTLVCSTSCSLTNYTWYKNTKYVYEDASPWYQELVSSDEAVTYSCSTKDYKDVRAPEVSGTDEVTFFYHPSTKVRVQRTPPNGGRVSLTCNTSCSLSEPQPAFSWYKNRQNDTIQSKYPSSSPDTFSCAVKEHERLLSAEVCVVEKNCWTVNYVSRRICALEGSSVNISSEYSHPENQKPNFKVWYKIKEQAENLTEAAGRVEWRETDKNHHILTFKKVKKNDSAEYAFRAHTGEPAERRSDVPGVTLVVTDLRVKFAPSREVTEGDRVTLTCATSCPLTNNTNYLWYRNGRPLTPTETHKHLVLDPVSRQQAGSYSCGVQTHKDKRSKEKSLTVQSLRSVLVPVAAGAAAVVLVIIAVTVCCWIRTKRTLEQPSTSGAGEITVQQLDSGPLYNNICAQPTLQEEHHYGRLVFSKDHTEDLYSTMNAAV